MNLTGYALIMLLVNTVIFIVIYNRAKVLNSEGEFNGYQAYAALIILALAGIGIVLALLITMSSP